MERQPAVSRRPTRRPEEALAFPQPTSGGPAATANATPSRTADTTAHPHRRLTAVHLPCLRAALTDRDHSLLVVVAQLRLISGRQVQRLFFTDGSALANTRRANRCLHRLVAGDFLTRLDRRIGGLGGGSDGALYGLGLAGRHLLRQDGKPRRGPMPSDRFVRHTLALAEVYTALREAERRGELDLLAFAAEPDCWRPHLDATGRRAVLKPDAAVVLGVGDWEQHAFVEADLGTVSVGTLGQQLRAYVSYCATGIEQGQSGVFPQVVWLTTSTKRADVLSTVIRRQVPPSLHGLFQVAPFEQAVPVLAGGRP